MNANADVVADTGVVHLPIFTTHATALKAVLHSFGRAPGESDAYGFPIRTL